MSDTIDRQAAIEIVDRYDKSHMILKGKPMLGAASIVIELEALPSAQLELANNSPKVGKENGEWIPCSERLPEYNESVLTWDGYDFCIEKRIPYIRDDDGEPIEGDWWVGNEYDEYASEYYPNLRDGAAIAWMPLPEPYKGGDAE